VGFFLYWFVFASMALTAVEILAVEALPRSVARHQPAVLTTLFLPQLPQIPFRLDRPSASTLGIERRRK